MTAKNLEPKSTNTTQGYNWCSENLKEWFEVKLNDLKSIAKLEDNPNKESKMGISMLLFPQVLQLLRWGAVHSQFP